MACDAKTIRQLVDASGLFAWRLFAFRQGGSVLNPRSAWLADGGEVCWRQIPVYQQEFAWPFCDSGFGSAARTQRL